MKKILELAALLAIAALLTAAAPPLGSGVPGAVHYIDHEKVAATLVKGGTLVSDPGLVVLANRRGAGQVEFHEHTNHIFIIVEGEGTLITGGTLVGEKRLNADQVVATAIEGGEVHHMTKGDVITIPAKTPHWWKDVSTSTIAYYAVNIESQ